MKKKIYFSILGLMSGLIAPCALAADKDAEVPTRIIGHWNYPANSQNTIYVNSEAPDVVLLINGVNFGHGKKESDSLYRFDNVFFIPGDLTAVSYDSEGKELSRHNIQTAGVPAQLKITVKENQDGFSANGTDTAMVQFRIEDFYGRRCFADDRLVTLEIDGPAEWVDKASQGGNHSFALSKKLENGLNQTKIKSTEVAGEIKVTAKAKGLAPVSVTLNSKQPNE